jgi:alkanesulfonate monooxygenase SsuD/methylene tetrahydromethanopterin reductase-like flavin-dependent oxidoreductase (luciferase family)
LVLGVGVGTLKEEFDLLGVPFDDRGERADDAMRALRASLSRREPAYDGTHYSYGGLVIDPCAVQPRVPIWVGGRTRRSLRRAAELGDGWTPFAVSPPPVWEWLDDVEPGPDFEVVLAPARPLDPSDHPDETTAELAALAEAGATIVKASLVHHSVAHCIEQLEALAGLAAAV